MKKLLLVMSMALCLFLFGCQSAPATPDPNEVLKESLIGEWKNVNDGDVYVFNEDGTGTHDEISISYRIEEEIIYIVEGASSVNELVFNLDTSGEISKLIPEDKSTYFVLPDNYEAISEQIKTENLNILMSYEYWSNTQGLNYVMFSEVGGWFLLSGETLVLDWEWQDNNTLKLSFDYNGTTYSSVVSLANENGEYKLVDDMGEVLYLPKNPLK